MAVNQGLNIQVNTTGDEKVDRLAKALDLVAKHGERVRKTQLDQAFKKMGPEIQKVNREMQRNIVLQQQSGKATRRMELGFQQAGYQFQDLVVQLQGGVNPFVAISQQGSQLASFFAGPWGASIGLAIAALGALGTTLMATSGLGKTLKEELGELGELEDALENFGDTFGKKFIGNIEEVRATFGNLVADIYEQEIREMQGAVGRQFKAGFGAGFAESAASGTDDLASIIGSSFLIPSEAEVAAAKEIDRRKLEIQEILNKLSSEDIVSKSGLAEAFEKAYDELENLGYITDEYLGKLAKVAVENGINLGIIKNKGNAQKDVNDLLEDEKDLTEDLNKLRQDGLNDRDKAEAKILKQQGRITDAMKLEQNIAERVLRTKAEQAAEGKALTTEQQNHLDAAIAAAREAIALKYELEEAKDEAQDMAKALSKAESALSRMQGFGNSLSVALAKAKAEADALATGADVQSAKTIAGYREQLKQKVDEMRAAGVEESIINAEKSSASKKITELSGKLAANAKERERQRQLEKSGKSAQSDQEKYEEFLRKQQAELDLRQKIIGMTDEQTKRAEYHNQLVQKSIELGVEKDEKAIQGLMAQYDMVVQLEKRRDIVNDIGDAFEETLMSVADGSTKIKDAFEKLMFDIAKMVYQQALVDPAVDALKSFLFAAGGAEVQAMGGIHSRGNVVPFANGGVIGGPTLFPMARGIGLMGEAGPEAIMPLKRGKDGKLGIAGGNTTVVQNFNFSANGDESVKRIIAQEAPKIADMTSASIMDQRRRGGSMRKTFS